MGTSAIQTRDIDYDRAGNMVVTPKPGDPANAWDVTYDAWNRVVEVTDGTTTVTYEYDGTVRRLGYGYDDLGRRQTTTSYSDTSGTTVVNQVRYAYDGWGNLIEEWQDHDSAVNTSTSESTQYVYDDGVASGVAKYVRLTDVIYPNGRDVVYEYGTTGSTDDVLSRIQSIGDGTDNYSVYSYLGCPLRRPHLLLAGVAGQAWAISN